MSNNENSLRKHINAQEAILESMRANLRTERNHLIRNNQNTPNSLINNIEALNDFIIKYKEIRNSNTSNIIDAYKLDQNVLQLELFNQPLPKRKKLKEVLETAAGSALGYMAAIGLTLVTMGTFGILPFVAMTIGGVLVLGVAIALIDKGTKRLFDYLSRNKNTSTQSNQSFFGECVDKQSLKYKQGAEKYAAEHQQELDKARRVGDLPKEKEVRYVDEPEVPHIAA